MSYQRSQPAAIATQIAHGMVSFNNAPSQRNAEIIAECFKNLASCFTPTQSRISDGKHEHTRFDIAIQQHLTAVAMEYTKISETLIEPTIESMVEAYDRMVKRFAQQPVAMNAVSCAVQAESIRKRRKEEHIADDSLWYYKHLSWQKVGEELGRIVEGTEQKLHNP